MKVSIRVKSLVRPSITNDHGSKHQQVNTEQTEEHDKVVQLPRAES